MSEIFFAFAVPASYLLSLTNTINDAEIFAIEDGKKKTKCLVLLFICKFYVDILAYEHPSFNLAEQGGSITSIIVPGCSPFNWLNS